MRTRGYLTARRKRKSQGSILAYLIIVTLLAITIAGVGAYVSATAFTAHRRCDMISAEQCAEGGAVIACDDLNDALMITAQTLDRNLTKNLSSPYTKNGSLSTSLTNVYDRSITFPFTNQTVTARLYIPNVAAPSGATVSAIATVGMVTQTATVHVAFTFGGAAAIISVNDGITAPGKKDSSDEASPTKSVAQNGNVVVAGSGSGPLVVDGNKGSAIIANGVAAIDFKDSKIIGGISQNNFKAGNPIPDFTAQGTTNALFDFSRFIAVANATTNSYNTNTHNNHFVNVATFSKAMATAPSHTLEGVIVVDIKTTDKNWSNAGDAKTFPNGINIHGTLFYNFDSTFTPTDKFVMDAALNINAANLTGLVATNPATYKSMTGYPPVYTDPNKAAYKINIMPAYQNFTITDDLPAMMNSIGMVDIHGPANVCGVCYTPSYMEIENKQNSQTQYFKGTMIMGWGIYYENNSKATSVISYDANAIQNLATAASVAKSLFVNYWE